MFGTEAIGAVPFVGSVDSVRPSEDAWRQFVRAGRDRTRYLIEVDATELAGGLIGAPEGWTFGDLPYGDTPGGFVTLGETTFFFGDGRWWGKPGDTLRRNRSADARITASADIERSLALAPEADRRAQASFGEIELANPDGALDDLLARYSIGGREVRIYLGPAAGTFQDFRLIGQLLGDQCEGDLDRVLLRVASTASLLAGSLYSRRYTGAGFADGDQTLAERWAPVTFGQCFNVTPVLVNKDQYIYQIHDGPMQAVDAVKERGLPFTGTGDVANYAALRAAPVASGTFKTCLAEGLAKVGFSGGPAGPVTMDVRGDSLGGYVNTIGDILYRAATVRARIDPSLIDQIGLGQLPTGVVGYYADGAADFTVAALFDALLKSVNGWYGTRRDKVLRVGYVTPPENEAAEETYSSNIVDLLPYLLEQPARYEQAVTWGKNWTPLADADVSLALPEATRQTLMSPSSALRKRSSSVRVRERNAIVGDTLDTYFVASSDAQAVLERIMALFRETRRQFKVTLQREGFLVDLGSVVAVKHPRFDLSGGKKFVVAGVREDGRRGQVELTIWGGTVSAKPSPPPPPPPTTAPYVPKLDFSDPRNSQYVAVLFHYFSL